VVSSRINHNKGAENARRQTDKETGQNVQRLMTTTPRRTSLDDHCHARQLLRTFPPPLPRRNWQSILQTWCTRCSHVLLFSVKRVVDPSHGPIRGPCEIASAILKAIPTRNRNAIAAQLFLVSGSQNQEGSSISMARTKKGFFV